MSSASMEQARRNGNVHLRTSHMMMMMYTEHTEHTDVYYTLAAVRYNGGLDPLVVSNFNFYF